MRARFLTVGIGLGAVLAVGLYSSAAVKADDAAPAPAAPATPTAPAATPVAPAAAEAPADLKPFMKTEAMMEFFFEDLQKALSASMKAEPDSPRAWKELKKRGDALAELSNLVVIHSDYDDKKTWHDMTLAMRAASLDLAAAADAKNFADAQVKYTALITSCNACHKKFEPDTGPEIKP